jgi:iron complex transport system ATP-binding protein
LFDEPGNTLDLAGQLELREAMKELARAGLGIVLVTHHVSEIIPEIERVVLLQKGRVLADGRKDELLTNDRLSELFGVPVKLFREDGYFYLHA